jgi:hypothetical protein
MLNADEASMYQISLATMHAYTNPLINQAQFRDFRVVFGK